MPRGRALPVLPPLLLAAPRAEGPRAGRRGDQRQGSGPPGPRRPAGPEGSSEPDAGARKRHPGDRRPRPASPGPRRRRHGRPGAPLRRHARSPLHLQRRVQVRQAQVGVPRRRQLHPVPPVPVVALRQGREGGPRPRARHCAGRGRGPRRRCQREPAEPHLPAAVLPDQGARREARVAGAGGLGYLHDGVVGLSAAAGHAAHPRGAARVGLDVFARHSRWRHYVRG
mmetsp:Transcript_70207/g.205863  ORF Transcript_70207/g.205863 Transcript_70207/m.205863 type:complete len:226 (+) Transcript_70207:767-1444(+)